MNNFEAKLARLEEITAKLENENISLEENLKLYQESQVLIKELLKLLSEAKEKVNLVDEK